MALTYTPIATTAVGSGGAANIEFTSIPNTYTDLLITYSLRGVNAHNYSYVNITFNGSTTGYSNTAIFSDGQSVNRVQVYIYTTLTYLWGGIHQGGSTTSNTFGNGQIYIPNYAGSSAKVLGIEQVSENNATAIDSCFALLNSGLWDNTAAITSIKLENDYGNWAQHSTATLYGIKNTV